LASDEHGIQAPFLYELYNQCFKKDKIISDPTLENIRKTLLKNNQTVLLDGFGAKPQKKLEKIANIAKNTLTPRRYCILQSNIIKHLQSKNIIEIGSGLGIQSLYFAKACRGKVVSIEGEKSLIQICKQNAHLLKLDNIEYMHGDFDTVLDEVFKNLSSIDYLYIDGNHTYDATIRYFENAIPYMSKEGIIVLDDINWSGEMQKAWRNIKKNKEITLSIDIFRMGFVFLSKKLSKQDFYLKF
jgi:predicted O-methyltransferase YrrM